MFTSSPRGQKKFYATTNSPNETRHLRSNAVATREYSRLKPLPDSCVRFFCIFFGANPLRVSGRQWERWSVPVGPGDFKVVQVLRSQSESLATFPRDEQHQECEHA